MNDIERKVIEEIVINTVKKLMAEKDAPNRVPMSKFYSAKDISLQI